MQHRQSFINESTEKAFDKMQQAVLCKSLDRYAQSYKNGIRQFTSLVDVKNKVSYYRLKGINDLEKCLVEFENNFLTNKGKLYWANDTAEAITIISELLEVRSNSIMVKSKSMLSEELEINSHLKEKANIFETNLGQYIVQLRNEAPSHITDPALHLSKEKIISLFNAKFGFSNDASIEELTEFVRNLLRDQFIKADIGMSGANFLLADIGGIALTENEGNVSLTTSWPRVHIVVAGIEKIIPSYSHLGLLWPVLSSHATGQKLSVYNHIICGPKRAKEADGPEEMHLILVDNNRTALLKDIEMRKALCCIKCGACLNVCPVYKTIGGHSYNTVYNGPIGAVVSPHLKLPDNYFHLSFASTLCEKCSSICPSNIDIHELLLRNRQYAVQNNLIPRKEKFTMSIIRFMLKNRKNLDRIGGKTKNRIIRLLFKKNLGRYTTIPNFTDSSFNKTWKNEHGIK